MKKLFVVMVCLLIITGCSVFRKITRARMHKLQIGMNKEQVLRVMGKPALTEADDEKEIWHYTTSLRRSGIFWIDAYSPLLFTEGRLVSWSLPDGALVPRPTTPEQSRQEQ